MQHLEKEELWPVIDAVLRHFRGKSEGLRRLEEHMKCYFEKSKHSLPLQATMGQYFTFLREEAGEEPQCLVGPSLNPGENRVATGGQAKDSLSGLDTGRGAEAQGLLAESLVVGGQERGLKRSRDAAATDARSSSPQATECWQRNPYGTLSNLSNSETGCEDVAEAVELFRGFEPEESVLEPLGDVTSMSAGSLLTPIPGSSWMEAPAPSPPSPGHIWIDAPFGDWLESPPSSPGTYPRDAGMGASAPSLPDNLPSQAPALSLKRPEPLWTEALAPSLRLQERGRPRRQKVLSWTPSPEHDDDPPVQAREPSSTRAVRPRRRGKRRMPSSFSPSLSDHLEMRANPHPEASAPQSIAFGAPVDPQLRAIEISLAATKGNKGQELTRPLAPRGPPPPLAQGNSFSPGLSAAQRPTEFPETHVSGSGLRGPGVCASGNGLGWAGVSRDAPPPTTREGEKFVEGRGALLSRKNLAQGREAVLEWRKQPLKEEEGVLSDSVDGLQKRMTGLMLGPEFKDQHGLREPGAIFIGATAVIPENGTSPQDAGGICHDTHIPPLRRIADQVHSQKILLGIQLAHAHQKASVPQLRPGIYQGNPEQGGRPDEPVEVQYKRWKEMMRGLAKEDILRIEEAFVAGAKRALAAGVDMVEVDGTEGQLIHTFLSPTNFRLDEYGRSPENRMRFALEVAEKVRAVWPSDKPVFFRLSGSVVELNALERPSVEQTVELAQRLQRLGVDVLDESGGGYSPHQNIKLEPENRAKLAEKVEQAIPASLPVSSFEFILDEHQANATVVSGTRDLVVFMGARTL